jgi:outer membrane protein OmpA-like peptidoglycan-associated protein
MKSIFLLILIKCLFQCYYLFGQESLRDNYGIYGAFSLNIHDANFMKIPDCPSCSPGYRNGNGTGANLGLVYDAHLQRDLLLGTKVLYRGIGGELSVIEPVQLLVSGVPTLGEFKHTINSSISIFGIESTLRYSIVDNLFLSFGVNISYLLNKDYQQYERIISPVNVGTFLDANGQNTFSRERNVFSGELQNANTINLSPLLSLSYKLPLNSGSTLFLEPELSYYHGITNIVIDPLVQLWTVNSISLGLSVKYSPKQTPIVVPKEEHKLIENIVRIDKIDTFRLQVDSVIIEYSPGLVFERIDEKTIGGLVTKTITTVRTDTIYTQRPSDINCSIVAVGVDTQGEEVPNPTFKIEEYVSNELNPLLNYVFFEDNSSTLPKRYSKINKDSASKFFISNLFRDSTLPIYYNLLNIVGRRMIENPTATLTIIGCNSDYGNEKGNMQLSIARANTVENYLIDVWGISHDRLKLSATGLSSKPSTPIGQPDKIAENRRVELYSDDPKILEYIFIEKIDRTANPPIARFKLSVQSELPISNWSINANQKSMPTLKFMKKGNEVPANIDWILSSSQKITPQFPEVINSAFIVEDISGTSQTCIGNDLRVNVKTVQEKRREMEGDYEIERFSLILFDFDEAKIDGMNKQIIDFIGNRLRFNSEIEIYGYTDRTGSKEYNRDLSDKRAQETKKLLKRTDINAKGIGSSTLLYDNEYPEGRFYCRTVQIIVKTKVQ